MQRVKAVSSACARHQGQRVMFSRPGLGRGSRDVSPRQEIVDLAVRMAVDDPREHVGQISERVDILQLERLDERSDDGPVFGAAVRVREEAFFRLSTIARIDRSTVLESSSMRPTSRRRKSASRRDSV